MASPNAFLNEGNSFSNPSEPKEAPSFPSVTTPSAPAVPAFPSSVTPVPEKPAPTPSAFPKEAASPVGGALGIASGGTPSRSGGSNGVSLGGSSAPQKPAHDPGPVSSFATPEKLSPEDVESIWPTVSGDQEDNWPPTSSGSGTGVALGGGSGTGVALGGGSGADVSATSNPSENTSEDAETETQYRLGDPVSPRSGLDPLERVSVTQREPVTLVSGRTSDAIPGLPVFPMPGPIRAFEVTRDGYGRYMLPHPDTGNTTSFTRATTVAKKIGSGDTRSLDKWRDRMLLNGIIRHPELVEGLEVDLFDTAKEYLLKDKLAEVAERARTAAGSDDKREFGTAVHAWTEALDIGAITFDQVPEMFQPYVAVYADAIYNAGIEIIPQYVERIVYCPDTGSVGTADRIYGYQGELVIGDLKTSSNIAYSWASISSQLAQYSDATHIWSEDGTHWEPMPPVNKDFAIIAEIPALPSDRDIFCDLHQINLHTGRENNRLAMAVTEANRGANRKVPLARIPYERTSDDAVNRLLQGEVPTTKTKDEGVPQLPSPPREVGGALRSTSHALEAADREVVDTVELPDDTMIGSRTFGKIKDRVKRARTLVELDRLYEPEWEGTPAMQVAYERAAKINENMQRREARGSSN